MRDESNSPLFFLILLFLCCVCVLEKHRGESLCFLNIAVLSLSWPEKGVQGSWKEKKGVGLQSSVIWSKIRSYIQVLCKHKRSSASPRDPSTIGPAVCGLWQWEAEALTPSSCLTQSKVFEYYLHFCGSLPPENCHCTLVQGRLCPGVHAGLCKPRSCTHMWRLRTFLGLCVIKDIKRSGVEAEPA